MVTKWKRLIEEGKVGWAWLSEGGRKVGWEGIGEGGRRAVMDWEKGGIRDGNGWVRGMPVLWGHYESY